ncbi:hypothetical protein B7P43_G17910, partial [Cryptotermes secundus]
REELTGGWRKLHEELHNLCTSPSIIRMIMSRRMRWVGWIDLAQDRALVNTIMNLRVP